MWTLWKHEAHNNNLHLKLLRKNSYFSIFIIINANKKRKKPLYSNIYFPVRRLLPIILETPEREFYENIIFIPSGSNDAFFVVVFLKSIYNYFCRKCESTDVFPVVANILLIFPLQKIIFIIKGMEKYKFFVSRRRV